MIEAVAVVASEAVVTLSDGLKETAFTQEFDDLPNSFHENIDSEYEIPEESSANYIDCRNKSCEGKLHPITGVEFIGKEIETPDGIISEGVFPVFESAFDAQLDESQYSQSDARHFKEANSQLKEAIENDPDLRDKFTSEELEQIEFSDTPDGYVWHHSEESGTLQLVDSTIHAQTGHTGGRSIWGGGNDQR